MIPQELIEKLNLIKCPELYPVYYWRDIEDVDRRNGVHLCYLSDHVKYRIRVPEGFLFMAIRRDSAADQSKYVYELILPVEFFYQDDIRPKIHALLDSEKGRPIDPQKILRDAFQGNG